MKPDCRRCSRTPVRSGHRYSRAHIVRCDHMELVCQLWNQVTKHVRRAGKAVQKYDSRRVDGARLTVEQFPPPNLCVMISCHGRPPLRVQRPVFRVQRSIAIDRPRGGSHQEKCYNTSHIEQIALVPGRPELCSPVFNADQLD